MAYRKRTAELMRRLANLVDDPTRFGGRMPRNCPLCGFDGLFQTGGEVHRRRDARCPRCGSLERHRLLKCYLDASQVLRSRPRVLHFAPELTISDQVRPHCAKYLTADYMRDDVDIKTNIEAIELDSGAFDLIICSDVLEHVDDASALPELYRVLAAGGSVLLHVPIVEGLDKTYENPEVTAEQDRIRHFGQRDHIRLYGRDFRERVRKPGFELTEFTCSVADCLRYALIVGERIFVARRPQIEAC